MARTIQVNAKAFESSTFYPIPVGDSVRVSVFDVKEGVTGPNSKNPGSPQFEFTAKVVEDHVFNYVDPDTGESGTQNALGRELRYNYIPLDPEAGNAWALVAFAEAVGWPTSKEKGVEVPDDLTDVLGTEFIAKIGQSKGQNGNTYNNVRGYKKVGGSKPGKEAKAEVQDWANL